MEKSTEQNQEQKQEPKLQHPDHPEQQEGIGQIFSTRNPKDAAAGLSSGLKSMGKGVLGGVASLIALPLHGAREEGALGFAKGLGLGVLSAAAMTVGGIGTGVVQIGRGIANTPQAMSARVNHLLWDEEKRVWYAYSLVEEKRQFDEQEVEERAVVDVKSMEYYDIIGVPSTATPAEIKKAYRTQAIRLHPDKNLSDPEASVKFQKLGEAYQILSNPQLRAVYDSRGKDGIETNGLLDSQHLFEMVFGAGGFEAYVGELQLLSMQESLKAMSGDEKVQVEGMRRAEVEMKRKQKKRELTCALKLAATLDKYLQDQSEDHINFKTFLKQEAESLTGNAFGGTLIGVVGYVYEEQAVSFLGFKTSITSGLGINNLSQSAHVIATKAKVVSSAIKMYKLAKEEEKKGKEGNTSGPDAKAVSGLMETLWNYTVVDVEATLRSVCTKVLKDSSIPLEDRFKRAEGLLIMGQVFQGFGKSAEDGLGEVERTVLRQAGRASEDGHE